MLAESDLRALLTRASAAPSGDNSQPWEFALVGDGALLYNAPHADETLFNYRQRGSYVAHGAVLENIRLLAAEQGYAITIELFPCEGCTARIRFVPAEPVQSSLTAHLEDRVTNRKPYRDKQLAPAHTAALRDAVLPFAPVMLTLIEDPALIARAARELTLSDRLLLEHREVHDLMFSMIRWSSAEELASPGLPMRAMELPVPVRFMFKHVFRHWRLVSMLNWVRFSRVIAAQTERLYRASGALGLLTVPKIEDGLFVETGQALQRLWLTAAEQGISLQPVTAIPYLAERVADGAADMFSAEHRAQIMHANERLEALGSVSGAYISFIVRLGYGEPPSARARKRAPTFRLS